MSTRNKYRLGQMLLAVTVGLMLSAPASAIPVITGTPTIDSPPLLAWPDDVESGTPNLTEATANRLYDLHGDISVCDGIDLVLSTAGNYHMALRDLWRDVLLKNHGSSIRNWYYSTSPPIGLEQINNRYLSFGNLTVRCRPQVVVAPPAVIDDLVKAKVTVGDRFPVFTNRGNVILVKKGNPRHIHSVWDLGRPDVRVVTPNPTLERSTFDNYSNTIYNIALNDPRPGRSADDLYNSIFNNTHIQDKWLAGARIHHRETTWSVAYGRADAGLLFYHIALDAVRKFPDLFDIVPLGGTADDPQPVTGNRVGQHQGIRIDGNWNSNQLYARELLVEGLQSSEFADILRRHGMQAPVGY